MTIELDSLTREIMLMLRSAPDIVSVEKSEVGTDDNMRALALVTDEGDKFDLLIVQEEIK